MKKLLLLLFICVLTSCLPPCGPTGLYIKVVPEFNGEFVDTVDVQFEQIDNTKTTTISPDIKNKQFRYEKELNCYYGIAYVEYNVKDTDVLFLNWAPIQSILDNYTIKITDPNGIYKEYNTPILRELIENSEYKDRKLSCYDENGKIVPEMVFSITF